MKKMLLLIMFLVFMLSVSIDVKALNCEYTEDSKGMVVLLTKGAGYNVGWQVAGGGNYSNYRFTYAGTDTGVIVNCPSIIYYGCNTNSNLCFVSEKSSDVLGNNDRGTLRLKTSGNSQSGNSQSGNTGSSSSTSPNYGLGIFGGVTGNETCPAIFGSASDPDSIFGFMSKYIFTPIRWLTPIILIVLTSLDFAKAIFMDEKDGMGKAKGNFMKRAVAALIIFLAPTIVSILLTLIDGANVSECMKNAEIGNL